MENNLSIIKDNFKELPNNIEAEQAVIGSILVTNEIFDDINTIIGLSSAMGVVILIVIFCFIKYRNSQKEEVIIA